MKKNYFLRKGLQKALFLSAAVLTLQNVADAQCLNTIGQWPSSTYNPANQGSGCDGLTTRSITTCMYAGEHSLVTVANGQTYTFTSTTPTDYLTISNAAGTTAYTQGLQSVTWVSTVTGDVRVNVHLNAACGTDANCHELTVICGTPPTCLPPSQSATTNITTAGATLNWTASSSTPANGYEYYYSTSNTAPTAGTTASGNVGAGVLTANIGSLAASTTYYTWVRAVCSASDKSPWTASQSFTTQTLVPRPWTEGFGSFNTPDGFTMNGAYVGSLTGLGGNPGNSAYMNLYSSNPAATIATLNVGPVLATDVFSFEFKNNDWAVTTPPAVTNGHYKVFVSTNFGATYTQIDSVVPVANSNWNTKTYPLASYAGQNVKFKIEGFWNAGDFNFGFDNFFVGNCLLPSNMATTAVNAFDATITWSAPSVVPANGYSYYLSTSNTAPSLTAAPTGIVTTGTTANPGSLTPATQYYFWLRSRCSATDSSAWVGPLTFTTACVPVTMPYIEEFSSTTFAPQCWSQAYGLLAAPTVFEPLSTQWNRQEFGDASAFPVVNGSARINIYGTGRRGWLISPTIDLGTTPKYLEFDMSLTDYYSSLPGALGAGQRFAVVVSTDNGVTWSSANVVRQWTDTSVISNTSTPVALSLAAYTGMVKIAFYGEATNSATSADVDLFIDNIEIVNPPCVPPVVALGQDTTVCAGTTLTLNAGTGTGLTYAWSTGASTATLDVTATGTYHVTVSNGTCEASDTIVVSVVPNPVVDLGNDTTDCVNGGPITLTAGTSTANTYLWSNNATTPSISATTSGTYYVSVTNAAGCTSTDTIVLVMGQMPVIGGINVTGTSPVFNFTAEDPENVTEYIWDFGDNSTGQSVPNTSHTYTPGSSDQAYTVRLIVTNECGSDTVETSVIVRANSLKDLDLNADALKMYPNPTANKVTLENMSQFKMKQVVITNVLGQQVAAMSIAGNTQTIDVSNLTTGLYHVKIEFEEGSVTRKLEILK